MKKGFTSLILLLTIAAILAISGGAYYWWKQKTSFINDITGSNPAQQSIQDETKDWKTYRNDKYGFEFKYPSNFDIGETLSPARIFENPRLVSLVSLDGLEGMPGKFTVTTFRNSEQLSITDWIKKNRIGYYGNDIVVSHITMCGVSGESYASRKGGKLGAYFIKGELIYGIEWHGYNTEDLEGQSQFDYMVSNFKCF